MSAQPTGLIVPHKEAKGTDIFGTVSIDDDKLVPIYIVRSDLGYFMTPQCKVVPLHPTLTNGDHYFAIAADAPPFSEKFYVIKGNSFHQCDSLETDANPMDYELHSNCRGGDHYAALHLDGSPHFSIIFQERGKVKFVRNLSTDADAKEFALDDRYKKGIYFWGATIAKDKRSFTGGTYFAKQIDEWGFRYSRFSKSGQDLEYYSFPVNMLAFLPGGLSFTLGRSIGKWSYLKYIDNKGGETDIDWSEKVSITVGCNKSLTKSIERSWDVSASIKAGVATSCFTAELSLSAEYGGKSVNTKQEDWSEQHTQEEAISITIPAGKALYLWQFKFLTGDKDLLFCKYWASTATDEPPTDIPSDIPCS